MMPSKRTSAAHGAIEFVAKWDSSEPFADIHSQGGVMRPVRMLEGWAEERRRIAQGSGLEAEVAGWGTIPAGLLELLAQYRRAVALITIAPGQIDHTGLRQDGGWTGTGFLVGPNLLLTNHHVLNSHEVARAATIEFNYEWPTDKLLTETSETKPPSVRFKLSPDRLFVTSPAHGSGLDFTFCWITEKAAEAFGTIRMERGSFMIHPFEPTFVIHHPRGRPKEVSVDDTELLGVNATCLLYAADTDRGSSGACVFNRSGRLVALHHAFRSGTDLRAQFPNAPAMLSDGREVEIANEGIKISAIALDLEHRMRGGGEDAENAGEVLSHVAGSDTLTGIFGGLGRKPIRETETDHDKVLSLYKETRQDIDVAFWNMHWLLDAWHDQKQRQLIATAMTDLNLDVWCLTEVPPDAIDPILEVLSREFGEEFTCSWAHPESRHDRLATAVLWRQDSALLEPLPWPEELAELWVRDLPATHGIPSVKAAFRCPPPLFRLSKPGREHRVNLVPVSLRGLGEDVLRRRLASKLLIHAIDQTIIGVDNRDDWLIGGDFRPPLAREDSIALQRLDYDPMAAQDSRRGGAFSYIRSNRSAVGTVFVTGDITPLDLRRDFFEVMVNRTVDRYFQSLSGNRPTVLRLSLQKDRSGLSSSRFNDLVDAVLGGPAEAIRDADWAADLRYDGLSKPSFMAANRATWTRLLEMTNHWLTGAHGKIRPLAEVDLWVIVYAEGGTRNGYVDPNARHSSGEHGFLPLPDNIEYWNGAGAPAWNRPMPLKTNLEHYARYLGQLLNKQVTTIDGRDFYRDLFCYSGIDADPRRQARLLAGIVHGYFVSQNYGGRPVPVEHILKSYAANLRLDAMLAGTGYVHADTSVLVNRNRDIEEAIAAFAGAM